MRTTVPAGTTARLRAWGRAVLFLLVGTGGASSVGLCAWFLTLPVTLNLEPAWTRVALAGATALVLALAMGLLIPARRTEVVLAETLLGARFPDGWHRQQHAGRVERVRTSLWFTAHLLGGAAVLLAGVVAVPVGIGLVGAPWTGTAGTHPLGMPVLPLLGTGSDWVVVVAGAVALLVGAAVVVGLPLVATWPAEVMLGPSPRELMAITATQAARAAERNRVARDLHDSVGHNLSIISVLATAAVRTPEESAVRAYCEDIAGVARSALTDLDEALRVLRADSGPGSDADSGTEGRSGSGPGAGSGSGSGGGDADARTLADLDTLLERLRSAGRRIDGGVPAAVGSVPEPVSREGYRIVAEALTNAARYGTDDPTELTLTLTGDRLTIEVANRVGSAGRSRRDGGRGLVGIRERVSLLGGTLAVGPDDGAAGWWRLRAELPGAAARTRPGARPASAAGPAAGPGPDSASTSPTPPAPEQTR
ncbi:sensor histidine kinase [Actinopolymorpha singaporensis]